MSHLDQPSAPLPLKVRLWIWSLLSLAALSILQAMGLIDLWRWLR